MLDPRNRPDRCVESLSRHEPRDTDDHFGIAGNVEVIARCIAFGLIEDLKALRVNTTWHNRCGQLPAGRVLGLGRRITPCCDDVTGAT